MTGDDHPPLDAGLLEPGALAVALDYDAAWTPAAMAACDRFFCDDTAGACWPRKAAGARLAGIPGQIAGDLGELAAGRVPGPPRRRRAPLLPQPGHGGSRTSSRRAWRVDRARALGVGRLLPL